MTDDGMSSLQIAKQLRKVVSERTARRWQHSYRSTSTIDLETPAGRPRIIRTKNLIRKVKNRFIYKSRQSARKLANLLGISKGTIGCIIHDNLHLHAYHVTIEPNLNYEHEQRRVSFAYWVRKWLRKKDREKILFTDEKYFELDGIFNRQNDHVYAPCKQDADEHKGTRPTAKFPKRIMVWLAASKNALSLQIIFEPCEALAHEKLY
ncbi:unnamed protein product [Rotaria sp. Silwood2]|nr:unnamed protein product [Rotaria sp. Silwood2]